MSSSKIKNLNIESIDQEKNNTIDQFSKNFNNILNKYKYSKHSTNSNINESTKNNKKDSKIPNKSKKNSKENVLMELEFIYNDSKNPNKNDFSKPNTQINKTNASKTSNRPEKENISKKNNDKNIKLKEKIDILFNSPMNKTLSGKYKKDQNKYKSRQIKKNFSQKNNFENFLQNVKDCQIKREKNLKNLRNISLKKQNSENTSHPKISKNSLILIQKIKRVPLYQKTPLNEENKLEEKFKSFYYNNFCNNLNINLGNNNSFTAKSRLNNKMIEEKFNKIYEDNLKWKKDLLEKNDIKRKSKIHQNEKFISKYTFKPSLNNNSINIVEKMNRQRSIDYDINSDIYNNENEKELIEKMKMKIKPIISSYYSMNMPYLYKKTISLKRDVSDNNIRKNIYHNYNYKVSPLMKNKNYKMNYKIDEQKFKKRKKEHQKKEQEEINKKKKKDLNKKEKDNYLIAKIKGIQKEKDIKKKELYKLNIRQGTAWNLEFINNIVPTRKYGHIIKDIL